MTISVIIPVYNAAAYVKRAVDSALQQAEVGEVLLIEDGSLDDSLQLCKDLEREYNKVRLYAHTNGMNRGAGASRNLGLLKAKYSFIAFLDADDYYLKNRFVKTAKVFEIHPDAEGVYEAIDRIFENEVARQSYRSRYNDDTLITMQSEIHPDQLFEEFFLGEKGWFSIDGLTIKKSLLDRVGRMDENLKQTQDTDFILRLCLAGKLFSGSLDHPIAHATIHGDNRILNQGKSRRYRYLLFQKWFLKMLDANWSKKLNKHIVKGLLYNHPRVMSYEENIALRFPIKFWYLLSLGFQYPRLMKKLFL